MAYTASGTGVLGTTVAESRKAIDLLLKKISAAGGDAASAIKSVSLSGSTLSFFKDASPAADATPDFTVDLPAEYFVDQTRTKFAKDFNFATGGYTGATDPGLDGKPVMVLAVKGVDAKGAETVTYSFIDLAALADTGKMDKQTGATEDNLVAFDASGNAADSGIAKTAVVQKKASATSGNFAAFDANGDVVDSGLRFATDAEFDAMLADVGLLTVDGGSD